DPRPARVRAGRIRAEEGGFGSHAQVVSQPARAAWLRADTGRRLAFGGAVARAPSVALRLVPPGPGGAPGRADRHRGLPGARRTAAGRPVDRLPRPRPLPARDDRGPGVGEAAAAPAARGVDPGFPRPPGRVLPVQPRAPSRRRAAVAMPGRGPARE